MPTAKQKKLRAERETARRRRLHGQKKRPPREPWTPTPMHAFTDAAGRGLIFNARQADDFRETLEGLGFTEQPANPPSMSDFHDLTLTIDIPTRGKCPVCHFSQKVRKDGTMSRHDVYFGSRESDRKQCEGTGQWWDASASDV